MADTTASENRAKILVFAGTTEGRIFAKEASEHFDVTVSVATEYGGEIIREKNGSVPVSQGRMSQTQMEEFISRGSFRFVVDATHPYASDATKNIRGACDSLKTPYARLIRESGNISAEKSGIRIFSSIEKIADDIARNFPTGTIFVSTGSKELLPFTRIENWRERLFVRVIPSIDSLKKCADAGIPPSRIIAMQGPFSKKMNEAMFSETNSRILVTKISGKNGGFDEKIEAATELNMEIFAVEKPGERDGAFTDNSALIGWIKSVLLENDER